MNLAITWNTAADLIAYYLNSDTPVATDTGLLAWSGVGLASNATMYGAGNLTFSSVAAGTFQDVIVAKQAASDANMATINANLIAGTLTTAILDGIFGAGNYVWYKNDEQYESNGLAHIEAGGVNGANVAWNMTGLSWNAGNKAYIQPTPGAELLTNGNMETGDPPTSWDARASALLDGVADERTGGAGAQSIDIARNGVAFPGAQQSDATDYSGRWFIATAWLRNVTATSITLFVRNFDFSTNYGISSTVTSTSWTAVSVVNRVKGSGIGVIASVTAAVDTNSGRADDISLKLYTFADCLRAVAPASAAEPYASAKLTITADTQAGLVINLDDYTTPANCIHVWYDRADSKVYARELTAGTWGADTLAGIAATYSAGAYLEVRRIGTEVYVFYNGAYVGSWTTALTSANTLAALFATNSASYFEAVTSFPTDVYDHSDYA